MHRCRSAAERASEWPLHVPAIPPRSPAHPPCATETLLGRGVGRWDAMLGLGGAAARLPLDGAFTGSRPSTCRQKGPAPKRCKEWMCFSVNSAARSAIGLARRRRKKIEGRDLF